MILQQQNYENRLIINLDICYGNYNINLLEVSIVSMFRPYSLI